MLRPYVERLADGRYEFGTAVDPDFDPSRLINLDPELVRGGDTLTGVGLLELAKYLSIQIPHATAIVLKGTGNILDMWQRLDESVSNPDDTEYVKHAEHAREIFLIALEDAGMIVRHPDGGIEPTGRLCGPNAQIVLPSGFRDEMTPLML